MKNRSASFVLALTVAAAAFWMQAVLSPWPAFACSCVPPSNLAKVAANPGATIVMATVARDNLDETHTIDVIHTFAGAAEAGPMRIRGIGPNSDECQEEAAVGETWIFSLYRDDGSWATNICTLNGEIGEEDGDALLAEATRRFGPPPPSPSPRPPPSLSPATPRPTASSEPIATPTPEPPAPPSAGPVASPGPGPAVPVQPTSGAVGLPLLLALLAAAVGSVLLVAFLSRRGTSSP